MYKFNPLVTDALNTEPKIVVDRYFDIDLLENLIKKYGFYHQKHEVFTADKESMLKFAKTSKATNHNLWLIAVSIIVHSEFNIEEGEGYNEVSYVMQLLANSCVTTCYGVTMK